MNRGGAAFSEGPYRAEAVLDHGVKVRILTPADDKVPISHKNSMWGWHLL